MNSALTPLGNDECGTALEPCGLRCRARAQTAKSIACETVTPRLRASRHIQFIRLEGIWWRTPLSGRACLSMQDFRHVRAWESGVLAAVKVRKIVAKFPQTGYAELREQLLSAAESISNNIAEGREASSPKEFLRFLDVAARSSSETASELNLALEYGIAQKRDVFDTIGTIVCTRRMIRSLQATIRRDLERTSRKPRKRHKER